jgi:hypothetical protein
VLGRNKIPGPEVIFGAVEKINGQPMRTLSVSVEII